MPKKKSKTANLSEEEKLKNFISLIAPSAVNFRIHPEYFILGNTYRSVWAIRSYPSKRLIDSGEIAMLSGIGDKDGVTIHIYSRQISTFEQQQIFEAANRRNRMKASDLKITTATKAEQNMEDIRKLIARTHKNNDEFMHCAVYIEIIADNLTELLSRQTKVRQMLNQNKILVDKLMLQQKIGFACVMPNGHNEFGRQFERVLPASSVANLFPLSYSGKTDSKGFYLGRDKNGSNIIVDLRTMDRTNGHILVLGGSGQGKSYLLKNLAMNFLMAGKKIFILDPDDEFKDLAKKLGGTYLNMTEGTYCINPLEPRLLSLAESERSSTESSAENDTLPMPEAFKKGTILTQHIAYLRDFFRIYRNFEEDELDVIEIMLEETYKRAHISDSVDFSKLKPQDYPILSDLHKVITDKLVSYKEDYEESVRMKHPILYTEELLQKVGLGLRSICVGSSSRYFNNFTNVPNGNFIDFSVKVLLQTNENLKNAMFLNIFSYMSHKFLTEGDCALFVDELHLFVKNKLAIQYIASFMKQGRKKNSNVVTASQNPEDFLKNDVIQYTAPLLSIPSHSFLFHPGLNCENAEYQRALNVKPYEFRLIEKPKMGYCLYKCGNERYHLHVKAPAHRHNLIGDSGGKGAA